jgi:peroxiredoxin
MRFVPLACFIALISGAVSADDVPPGSNVAGQYGHSSHGEAFNEGPRQRGVLMPGTGNVTFPVTTTNDEAQKFFNQGVGQLHGFWYFEAERSFRQALALDPNCAMAFWGMAMSNLNNAKRGSEFIAKGVAMRDKASRREQLYIDSLSDYFISKQEPKQKREALIKALESIIYEFPDDVEAKAFLVYWLWDSKDKQVPVTSYAAVDALAKQVLAVNPMHPVHHYRIHLWNYQNDSRALDSAALCGQSAPGVAHMWHMPGHTYTRLKRYADAAWQQEASARTDHAHMIETRILPEQIHNYAHNNDWLVENLQFVGRVREAWDLAKNMVELPRPAPKSVQVGKRAGSDGEKGGFTMGRNRLVETALRFELWEELTALDGTMYLSPASDPADEARRLRALAIAYFGRNDKARGEEYTKLLEVHVKTAREDRIAEADRAAASAKEAKKPAPDVTRAMADALQRGERRVESVATALADAEVYRTLAKQDAKGVKDRLAAAKDFPSERKARVLLQIGDKTGAEAAAREALKKNEGQVLPSAILADVLWRVGKKSEAVEAFRKLREIGAGADLDVNVFARLAPVAKEAGFEGDWRPKAEFAKDSGVRPPLAQLGPFRWRPYIAPDFNLSDQTGSRISLSSFQGKPVLVMFYLGSGCSHCIEQLNVFGPLTEEYREAGISLVAVSTDSADRLHETFAKSKTGLGFPFNIVANPTLDSFKAYRSFDDFENVPLHGTFLIDSAGFVRWQDISYEPFVNGKWLLAEAKRLLALPVSFDGTTPTAVTLEDNPAIASP